jgi:DNA-binding NarL/FixJ family response regulator
VRVTVDEQPRSDRYTLFAARAASAAAQHQWSSERYRRARRDHLLALHNRWRVRSKVYNRFGTVVMVHSADGDGRGTAGAAPPVRALVVDGDVATRVGVRMILSATSGIEVIGEASSGDDAVAKARLHEPDVVVMAIRLPGTDGITATRRITTALGDRTKVVVYTSFDGDGYEHQALEAGASAFVVKRAPALDLVAAVRAAVTGAPAGPGALPPRSGSGALTFTAPLSARERSVLQLVATGLSNAEIAAHMYLSVDMVRTHLKAIYAKSGVTNRHRLVVAAQADGFSLPLP